MVQLYATQIFHFDVFLPSFSQPSKMRRVLWMLWVVFGIGILLPILCESIVTPVHVLAALLSLLFSLLHVDKGMLLILADHFYHLLLGQFAGETHSHAPRYKNESRARGT